MRYVLTLACPDQPGIVAAVTTCLHAHDGNILDAQQFGDPDHARFFARIVFDVMRDAWDESGFRRALSNVGDPRQMNWTLRNHAHQRRVLLMVSKFDHCLADILYRWRIGELPMQITGIISNYSRDHFSHHDLTGIAFHHLPITKDTKPQQEGQVRALITQTDTELVVLARYMQVLSDDFARELAGRCINIHHSFLPGFKGARPYHQAHARGVKLIGASAHYVTGDLDEGPIIEQDVERITHAASPDDLIRQGRDIERRVLSRALLWHLENRVVLNGNRTVVFAP